MDEMISHAIAFVRILNRMGWLLNRMPLGGDPPAYPLAIIYRGCGEIDFYTVFECSLGLNGVAEVAVLRRA